MTRITDTMNTLSFGIEIETVELGTAATALAVHRALGNTGNSFDRRRISMNDGTGRHFKVVTDCSLSYNGAEIVSPILTASDIPKLQEVVRAVRAAGGRVNDSCGIHIHVDGAALDGKSMRNLIKTCKAKEELFEHALGITDRAHNNGWCQRSPLYTVEAISAQRTPTHSSILNQWPTTRYMGLNLRALQRHGTVEFRWFHSSLHAGRVKAYVQFILALAAKAIVSRSATMNPPALNAATIADEGYAMRGVLLKMDLSGDEFKTCRRFLMERFNGTPTRAPQAAQAAQAVAA